ncbi:YbjN domain-containing protein [Aliiroseovarius marinus]|uniref:YbjN domain-containing protein n=1 Tax=Aliiroseovarius marinus TaxID=2500159 RepID=UPI003D7DB158
MKNTFIAAAFLLTGFTGHAFAEDTDKQVVASDPDSVLAYFEDLGAPAKLSKDKVGDPQIEIQYYGTKMVLFFYGCQDGQNCNSLQFFSGYTADHELTLEGVNTWNSKQRYGRAYIADDGRKMLEYDIYTGQDGVSQTDFDEIFDAWTQVLKSFESALS